MTSTSLWTDCKGCGKQVSVSARSCPHCGAKRSRYRLLKWIGGGVATVSILAALASPDKSETKNAANNKPTQVDVVISTEVEFVAPEKQRQFTSITASFEERFNATSNELQQNVLRDERRDAVVSATGADENASGWVGTIKRLETNTEGKAILSVRLSPNTSIQTWNNALSDFGSDTLIEKGTKLYNTLMGLEVGDRVEVSGRFFPSGQDGFQETSITLRGSMTDPEYLFKFSTVAKK